MTANSRLKSKMGFTMLELVISTGIILLLSAILIPNYNNLRHRFSLSRSAYKLAQDVRRIQEMATSAKEVEGAIPDGYGLYIEPGNENYLLYADRNQDEHYNPGIDTLIESISLEDGVVIGELSFSPLGINFRGPDPITRFSTETDRIIITLGLEKSPGETNRIIVNKVGLIYVE